METLTQNEKNPSYSSPKILQNDVYSTSERVNQVAHSFGEEMTSKYGNISDKLTLVSETSANFVKKYPLYSILGATAVGVVIGSMIRKKLI